LIEVTEAEEAAHKENDRGRRRGRKLIMILVDRHSIYLSAIAHAAKKGE
jgi:hypothetical protein